MTSSLPLRRGRRPGHPKTGGRKKGTPNKVTSKRRLEEAARAAGDQTPLDFLLEIMRDGKKTVDLRLNAAKAAAPYIHPARRPVDASGDDTERVVTTVVLSFG